MESQSTDIVLLSAGVESTTLLYTLREREPLALCIDYGQRAAEREYEYARVHCERLGLRLRHFDIGTAGSAFRAGQSRKLHVPIPHRNLFILSLSLCFAAQQGAARTWIALNREDAAAHASASAEFLAQLNRLAATLGAVRVEAPLLGYSKADVIQLGRAQGVDFALTYSCLLGRARHCGSCPQCQSRRRAFEAADSPEPAGFYVHR